MCQVLILFLHGQNIIRVFLFLSEHLYPEALKKLCLLVQLVVKLLDSDNVAITLLLVLQGLGCHVLELPYQSMSISVQLFDLFLAGLSLLQRLSQVNFEALLLIDYLGMLARKGTQGLLNATNLLP